MVDDAATGEACTVGKKAFWAGAKVREVVEGGQLKYQLEMFRSSLDVAPKVTLTTGGTAIEEEFLISI